MILLLLIANMAASDTTQEAPAISGKNIVFSYDGDILRYYTGPDKKFLTDDDEKIQITNTPSIEEIHPKISGQNVIWEAEGNIFLYTLDGDTGPVNIASGAQADIDGNTIVYTAESNLYTYSKGKTTQLTFGHNTSNPNISGDNIIFIEGENEITAIWVYYLPDGTLLKIINSNTWIGSPSIDGGNIVFTYDNEENGMDIALFNIWTGQKVIVTNWAGDQQNPNIDGDNLVYESFQNNTWCIYILNAGIDRKYGTGDDIHVQVIDDVNNNRYPNIDCEYFTYSKLTPDGEKSITIVEISEYIPKEDTEEYGENWFLRSAPYFVAGIFVIILIAFFYTNYKRKK